MKILIAGGGIGGVTAALCLVDAGFEVELFERAPALGEVGAGIQISPNGVKVLERLGLGEALARVAFRPEALEMRIGATGGQVFAIPMRDEALHRYRAPYYHVHRADLMAVLSEALRARAPDAAGLNKDVEDVIESDDKVALAFADGTRAEGDVLIGADGIQSRVRERMFGAMPARFTGNVAWRLVVPTSKLPQNIVPPTACIWVGSGRHAVTYYLRRGELVNFVGVVGRDDWRREGWTERGDKAELAADFAGWSKPVAAIIDQADACYRWALFDRDPLPSWSKHRATLLGDACHPMLPFLAQGAVMAIEDAWILSRKLKAASDIAAALKAYETTRKPRTTRVQSAARGRTGLYHLRYDVARFAAYGSMWLAARLAPPLLQTSQDWLYGYDPTVEAAAAR